jgi:MFS transporter, MHS family, proline/betaine transporter
MPRRAVIGASIGNCVEWFDFAVYGYLVQTLGAVFFPSGDRPSPYWPPSRSSG